MESSGLSPERSSPACVAYVALPSLVLFFSFKWLYRDSNISLSHLFLSIHPSKPSWVNIVTFHAKHSDTWSTFIMGLQNKNIKPNIAEPHESIGELTRYDLNGREIRNAIQTATLLAQFRKKRLAMEHLTDVISVSAEFKRYMAKRYESDEEYAQTGRIC